MIIDIVFLLNLNAQVVCLFNNLLSFLSRQLLQVSLAEKHHDPFDVRVQLADKGTDD